MDEVISQNPDQVKTQEFVYKTLMDKFQTLYNEKPDHPIFGETSGCVLFASPINDTQTSSLERNFLSPEQKLNFDSEKTLDNKISNLRLASR
jgi:hypothetical protein